MKVLSFEPPQKAEVERIWECSCGSRTFHLYSTGTVKCVQCDEYSADIGCYDISKEK